MRKLYHHIVACLLIEDQLVLWIHHILLLHTEERYGLKDASLKLISKLLMGQRQTLASDQIICRLVKLIDDSDNFLLSSLSELANVVQ